MKYHAGRRLPGGNGHVESGNDQASPHMRGDSPADYFARVKVDDGREIRPSVPRLYVGDVTAPAHVRERSSEVPADQVRGRDRLVPADGGPLPRLRVASPQPSGLHQ